MTRLPTFLALPSLLAAAALASGPAAAQPAGKAGCNVSSRNETVVVLVCPKGLQPEAWRDASVASCQDRPRCNVWIWDDAAKAPAKAPATDADMPKANAVAARAIWTHDTQNMILVRQVAK